MQNAALAAVAIPAEHGGWSFTLEPALLGLLIAPGPAGLALALAGLGAFLIRTPLKLALVDRRRGRRLARTRLAERVVAGEAIVLGVLLGVAATGDPALWLPLIAAAPLVAVELWYDVRSRSRRLVPELAGAVAAGSVAAAIVLAGGEPAALAAALWLVVAGRAVAAVPFVRVQLRRRKSQPHRCAGSDAAQVAAVTLGALAVAVDGSLAAGAAAIAALALVHVVAVRLPPPRVAALGAQQVALGLGVVLAAGLGVLAP